MNMKNTLLFLGFVSIFFSACTDEKDENTNTTTEITVLDDEDLIERMPNYYREYFPGKKQLKLGGPTDNDGKRHGVWESYFEHGQMNSTTYFIHGVKEGHSVVYYPNGSIHYIGEYKNDQKVGLWKTYNEQGELISEDEF
jgi:antitoxin component YwqK of YwqJK toxin-antitoxin module